MMCQRIGRLPISTIGLGLISVSSASRVPRPPASITTFNSPSPPLWSLRRPVNNTLFCRSLPIVPTKGAIPETTAKARHKEHGDRRSETDCDPQRSRGKGQRQSRESTESDSQRQQHQKLIAG